MDGWMDEQIDMYLIR